MMRKPNSRYLTEREKQVLTLVACDNSYEQIAVKLGISPRTVDAHLTTIRLRFEVSSTVAAVASAMSNGMIAI